MIRFDERTIIAYPFRLFGTAGALLAGSTADKFGRKRTIQLGALISVIGCGLQTGAVNVAMLIVGRVIAGE